MKRLKISVIIISILLMASVAMNVYLLSLRRLAEPEWMAAEVTEEEAAASGYNAEFMRMALDIAEENVRSRSGGPIGVVIVKDGRVIAAAGNEMHQNHNSYDHGEIAAIRAAEKELGKMYLDGCTLYTSAQPCVMCEAAIYWARISKVFYAASVKDTSRYDGFDDLSEYQAIYDGKNLVESVNIQLEDELHPLEMWAETRKK